MKFFKRSLTNHSCRLSSVSKPVYFALIVVPLFSAREPGESAAPYASEKYVIDQKQSVVAWTGSMAFTEKGGHTGYVSISKGELKVDSEKLVGGFVELDMNTIVDKVHGGDNGLVHHLKDPDFFDVQKFPTSTFALSKVEPANDGNVSITGDLTIKGITRPITFPATVEIKSGVIHADAKVVIDRTQWGIRYKSGKFFSSLADEAIADFIYFEMKIIARK